MAHSSQRIRFEKVASKRVQRVLEGLDVLSNCANKKNYEYDPEDVKKMMTAIRNKVRNLESRFNQESSKDSDNVFKF